MSPQATAYRYSMRQVLTYEVSQQLKRCLKSLLRRVLKSQFRVAGRQDTPRFRQICGQSLKPIYIPACLSRVQAQPYSRMPSEHSTMSQLRRKWKSACVLPLSWIMNQQLVIGKRSSELFRTIQKLGLGFFYFGLGLGEQATGQDQFLLFCFELLLDFCDEGLWEVESSHSGEEEVVLIIGVKAEAEGVVSCLNFCEFSQELEGKSFTADQIQSSHINTHHKKLSYQGNYAVGDSFSEKLCD